MSTRITFNGEEIELTDFRMVPTPRPSSPRPRVPFNASGSFELTVSEGVDLGAFLEALECVRAGRYWARRREHFRRRINRAMSRAFGPAWRRRIVAFTR